MQRINDYFLASYGVEGADDRRIASAIVFVIKNGLRWRRARTGMSSPPVL
jgi:putative transposase